MIPPDLPFSFKRLQFPTLTVTKYRQTFKFVVIYICVQIIIHTGYVVGSRFKAPCIPTVQRIIYTYTDVLLGFNKVFIIL